MYWPGYNVQVDTGTDNKTTKKQNTTYTLNTKEKQKKTALADKTIYMLVFFGTPFAASGQETE